MPRRRAGVVARRRQRETAGSIRAAWDPRGTGARKSDCAAGQPQRAPPGDPEIGEGRLKRGTVPQRDRDGFLRRRPIVDGCVGRKRRRTLHANAAQAAAANRGIDRAPVWNSPRTGTRGRADRENRHDSAQQQATCDCDHGRLKGRLARRSSEIPRPSSPRASDARSTNINATVKGRTSDHATIRESSQRPDERSMTEVREPAR